MSAAMQLVESFPQAVSLSETDLLADELGLSALHAEEEFETAMLRLEQLERENRRLRLELARYDHELRKRDLLLRNARLREIALRTQLADGLL